MQLNIDYGQWNNRKLALIAIMNRLEAKTQASNFNFTRKAKVKELIVALRDFATRHYDFFLNGFGAGTLTPSTEFPPDYVLRAVDARIANDIRVIEQIIGQREIYDESTPQGKHLKKADLIAREVLAAKFPKDSRPLVVLTYFERISVIRVIPYANAALIGIPFSTTGVRKDLLAICHEAGHYVYWNALNRATRKDLHTLSRVQGTDGAATVWLDKWVEEIFADAYGAVTGGAAMALNWQDFQSMGSPEELQEDDGDHPVPLLRPEIYLDVLQQKTFEPALIDKLRERWESLMKQKLELAALPTSYTLEEYIFSGEKITGIQKVSVNQADILAAVERFINVLFTDARIDLSSDAPLWSTKLEVVGMAGIANSQARDQAIYTKFDEAILSDKYDPETQDLPDSLVSKDWDIWVGEKKFAGNSTKEANWLDVFLAEGWTTEGPHTAPPTFP